MEISQPQNTINGATPADLSRDGDSGQAMLPEIARNAIAMRREQEQLLSDEAYTKALKANTDKNGVINYQGVNRDLGQGGRFASNNLLGYGQHIATSEQTAMERAKLADNYRAEMQKINALRNRGVITSDQADSLNSFNLQGLKASGGYGGGDTQVDSLVDTTLKTQPQEQHIPLGDRVDILNRSAFANQNTPYHVVNTLTTGESPDTRAGITSGLTQSQTMLPNGSTETQYARRQSDRYGNTTLIPYASTNDVTQRLTKGVYDELDKAKDDYPKLLAEIARVKEAFKSYLNNKNKGDFSIPADVTGIFGLKPGDMANRQVFNKTLFGTLQTEGLGSDMQREFQMKASGANSKEPEVAGTALLLKEGLLNQKLLHYQYLFNHMHDQNFVNDYYKVQSKYGKDMPNYGLINALMDTSKHSMPAYAEKMRLLNKYMPSQTPVLENLLSSYQQAEKDGIIPPGSFNSEIAK